MLHIVLLILKIIGIILLCILGILLLTILCVLFVPVRYRIELSREEGEGNPPLTVNAKITWLLHFVNIMIRYPAEEINLRVRILLFTLFRIPKKHKDLQKKSGHNKKSGKNKKKRKPAKASKPDYGNTQETEAQHPSVTDVSSKSSEERLHETVQKSDEELEQAADIQKAKTEENKNIPTVTIHARKKEEQDREQPASKPSFKKKLGKILKLIQNICDKIKKLIQNIQYTIKNFCDRIRFVLDQIGYYREIVASDAFQQSFQLCKGELVSVFKSLKPQKYEANLTIGMEDPATTGEILAIWGMLYPLIGEHVKIVGDFEQKRIEGLVLLKGKVRVFTFLKSAIRIYFNKDIKKLIKLLKKEAV